MAVMVVDPRRAFASDERFPGVTVSTDWPDEAMDALAPDSRTAVVTLTHDPKLDDPALDRALRVGGVLYRRAGLAGRRMRRGWSGCASWAMTRRRWRASAARSGWTSAAVTAPEIALSILGAVRARSRRGTRPARRRRDLRRFALDGGRAARCWRIRSACQAAC